MGGLPMYYVINNVLIGLNHIGKVFCDYAAGMFVQSALLVILLLVVDLLLRKRVRAVFRYCIWLLVLVKLILPPMLSLPTGIGYWVGDRLPAAIPISDRAFDVAGLERASPSGEIPHAQPARDLPENDSSIMLADSALTPLTWQAILFILWLMGVFAFLVVLVQRVRFVRGLIAVSSPAEKELLGLLEECRRKIGVRWDIRLRISETIPSPAVCGFFRPTVLIPTPLVEKLSQEALRATLIHELAHIKRGDLWVNSVQTFLQVIYFYNPFVWFANSIIRRICEEAVDETVLVTLGGQAKNYSNTLIDIGEMAFWRADLGLRLIGVAESKKALKWRIRHMLNRPIPKSAKIGVLGTIVIIVIAAVLLPMAKAGRETPNSVKLDENGRPIVRASDPAAVEIIQKVQAKYAGLDSYSSEGEIVSDMDMSGVDVDTIPGMTDARTKKLRESKELQEALKKRQTFKHIFSIKLARPDYYIEWDQKVHKKYSNIGAVWSDGKEHFLLINAKRKTSPKDRRMALASATGVSGGAANTIPSLFFAQPANVLHQLNEVRQEGEEAIDGDQCYIIAGKMANMTMKYWISKDTLLVRQRQQILGDKLEIPELSDEDIKKALESTGGQATDEAIRKFKDRIRLSRIMVSKMKGTITEIHRNIVINQPIDFKPYISKYADIEIVEPVIRTPEPQIAQGADVNTKDEEDLTSLHLAARQGRKDVVELLLADGANINARLVGWPGWTPLHEAATANHKEVAKLLITKGADTNANCARAGGGRFGGTPLHEAVFEGNRDMAELLISKGADINAKQSGGLTPLDVAAFVGHKDVVELLIARGADVNIRDRGGRTALRWAKHGRNKEIVELLQKYGAVEW